MSKKMRCDFNCDGCKRSLCTQDNSTIEKQFLEDVKDYEHNNPWVDKCDEITYWSNFFFR